MNASMLPALVTTANAAFTLLRVAANVPQLIAILRDPCGARAISVGSWFVFGSANGCNGLYAFVIAGDHAMFAINCLSALSCTTIAVTAWIKQRRARALERGAARQATSRAIANAAAAASPPMVNV